MSITYDKFSDNLDQLAAGFEDRLKAVMDSLASDIEKKAKDNAKTALHTRSGRLQNSIQAAADGLAITLSASAPYAGIHEHGGVIRPKSGKYLKIPVGNPFSGDMHFQASKRGGGVLISADGQVRYVLKEFVTIPSRPFLAPAMIGVEKQLEDIVAKLIEDGVENG